MRRKARAPLSVTIEAARSPELSDALERGWKSGLATRLVLYDPAAAERFRAPPYRFHFLPMRANRPGADRDPTPPREGLRVPHRPCPFDGEQFIEERELIRLERDGRVYHLTCNRFPITPQHFLAVRSAGAPPETLPQCLHGPVELEDILCVLVMLEPRFRVYFNSNRGADNSQSGSSVNHWHFQVFPYPEDFSSSLLDLEATLRRDGSGLRIGHVPDWPAHHVLVESSLEALPRAAHRLWGHVRTLDRENVAYNLEVLRPPSGLIRAFLFPRRPGPPVSVGDAGQLSPDFGGWELSGDIVVPTQEIFDWIRGHPVEAVRLTEERLRQTTRPVV